MTNPSSRVVEVKGGKAARLQLEILRMGGRMTRRFEFRGIQKLATVLSRVFDPDNSIVLDLPQGVRMRVLLSDGYWVKLACHGFEYEPEIGLVLETLLQPPAACVLDCGANIGYWSLQAATLLDRADRVVAVEASPAIFERLVENARLNGTAINLCLAAVWSHDDQTLVVVADLAIHPAGRVEPESPSRLEGPRVQSVSIDSLCDRFFPSRDLRIVVKLDVEGAEVPALMGASRLLSERRPLVIYEDHGAERKCDVSKFVLEELGLDVYFCGAELPLRRMESTAAVRAVKTNRGRGYNFFACHPSSSFAPLLAELARDTPVGSNDGVGRMHR